MKYASRQSSNKPTAIHFCHRADWIPQVEKAMDSLGAAGFRDRQGHLILVTRSAKKPGYWQATWFKSKGPYQDKLSPKASQLLLSIAPMLREWLSLSLIDQQLCSWANKA
ncbi:hypothetical protein ACFSJ3_04115 [Corallincola platygyrae]|uniref:Uncharacterized protein n=1 Tax=Corallincola platygyrae TaxID=1193278 RepID=A0ABW4XLJ8_9GAMM